VQISGEGIIIKAEAAENAGADGKLGIHF